MALADIVNEAIDALAEVIPECAQTVAFHGKRANARPVAMSVKCVFTEGDVSAFSDAPAPNVGRDFTLYVPCAGWRDETPPQTGEWLCFDNPRTSQPTWCKVGAVQSREQYGYWKLTATWQPGRGRGDD